MAATYLPVLISSVGVTAADDSRLQESQVSSQVDYLSHNWREEDVWRSWRSMTRQKNEIANGMRLENASWRTWWKQRNGLQTVSPETLNWLKDSDVTWLYGPFHTYDEHKPSISRSHSVIRSTTPPPSPSHPQIILPKPILKHRSVTEVLVAALPTPSPKTGLLDVSQIGAGNLVPTDGSDTSSMATRRPRPPLTHTRSETNLLDKSPFRRDSPPRIIADDPLASSESPQQGDSNAESTASNLSESNSSTKKHISFNTFVEQCIAIDKPNDGKGYHPRSVPGAHVPSFRGDTQYTRRSYRRWNTTEEDLEEESIQGEEAALDSDEEDEPIEIKPRSRSSSLGTSAPTLVVSRQDDTRHLEDLPAVTTPGREHVTIAPIAPTLLKTSSNSYSSSPIGSALNLTSPRFRGSSGASYFDLDPACHTSTDEDAEGDVPLLWVPPVGSGYEREFGLHDVEEEGAIFNARAGAIQGTRGNWGLSPPVHTSLNSGDYFSDERKGRTVERHKDRKGQRGHGSISPVETTSSSTISSSGSGSRSRSRSRNRSEFLSPSPDGRERQSRSRSRSGSLSRNGESPDQERHPSGGPSGTEQRGRTMSRNGSYSGSPEKRQNLRSNDSENTDRNSDQGGPGSSSTNDSDSSQTVTYPQSGIDSTGTSPIGETIAGIRGYIGSIWGS